LPIYLVTNYVTKNSENDGTAVFLPPLKVSKDGEAVEFWNKSFNNCFERSDWLKNTEKSLN
jgi:hypothetical protein